MADVKVERRGDYFLAGSRPSSRVEVHERAAAFAPLALRLSLGAIFVAHGVQKFLDLSAAIQGFEAMGFAPGALWAPLLAAVETLGGLALVAGFLTRWTALLILFTQLVAAIVVHLPNGFFISNGGVEFNLALIGGLVALVFLGSGKLGVDHERQRRKGRTVYREREVRPEGTPAKTEPRKVDLPHGPDQPKP